MRRGWSVATCLVMLAGVQGMGAPENAWGLWVESLVMPGEVIAKHARIERQCKKCHAPFDKSSQDRLCLDCHKDVAADLRQNHGHHGQDPSVRSRACKACHTEHRGRQADIVRLDRKKFDHRLTDMPLQGAHVRVACDDCHTKGKRYREVSIRCSSCHSRKDPHESSLGPKCDDCHGVASWKKVRFDHDASTFPLEGRHRRVPCDKCHASKRYKPTPRRCYACHERDDKHHGSVGTACESCHSAQSWSATGFDHARKTHFPLVGAHTRASCQSCHKEGVGPGHTPTTCQECHRRDDAHHGQFGIKCEACHNAVEWKRSTFVHGRSTRFPLRGRHAEVRCTECHTGSLYEERLDTGCYACHRKDDVHRGQEGTRCERCHDEWRWHRDVLFDHDLTRFPLIGAHARVSCAECHISSAFKDVAGDCLACHEKDDVHRGRLGARCGDCHNPVAWKNWKFDHDARTKFRLDGAHVRLACESCHREPVPERIELSQRCASCHDGDDVHRGQFGSLCERCHQTSTFRAIRGLR